MKNLPFLFIFFISFIGFSQNENQPNFWDNVQFGGGLGISFGSNQTTIAIAPSTIYNFNKYFSAGLGASYLYAKNHDVKSNVFGASVITLFNPFEQFQLSAEFEQLFVNQKSNIYTSNFDYPALYIGAAYRIGSFSAGLQYDVLYNDKSIFASAFSPIFRFYF